MFFRGKSGSTSAEKRYSKEYLQPSERLQHGFFAYFNVPKASYTPMLKMEQRSQTQRVRGDLTDHECKTNIPSPRCVSNVERKEQGKLLMIQLSALMPFFRKILQPRQPKKSMLKQSQLKQR